MNINKILENHKNDDFAKSFIQHQNIFLDIYKICNYNFNRKVGSYLFGFAKWLLCYFRPTSLLNL